MPSKLPKRLPFEKWPPLDQIAWRHAIDADPLLTDGGGGSHWRPATRDTFEETYGRWLSWLAEAGLLDNQQLPASRASFQNVRAYFDSLQAAGLAEYTIANQLAGLAATLSVMSPDDDFEFITRKASRTRSRATPPRAFLRKQRPRREIFDLGIELMEDAEAEDKRSRVRRAVNFRDGLLLCLWSLDPLRIANLGSIELGRNLARTRRGYRLRFSGDEMKAGRAIDHPWPTCLAEALARYLEHYRPILLGASKTAGGCQKLWVSQFGREMQAASVGDAIVRRTNAKFGAGMGPHLMRYIVATELAEDHPDDVGYVAAVLGHTRHSTSEYYYNLADGARAMRRHQEGMARRTREAARRRH